MRKNINAPRKIYTRGTTAFVNFNGKFYGTSKDATGIDLEDEVVCARVEEPGRPRILVKQGDLVEVWGYRLI